MKGCSAISPDCLSCPWVLTCSWKPHSGSRKLVPAPLRDCSSKEGREKAGCTACPYFPVLAVYPVDSRPAPLYHSRHHDRQSGLKFCCLRRARHRHLIHSKFRICSAANGGLCGKSFPKDRETLRNDPGLYGDQYHHYLRNCIDHLPWKYFRCGYRNRDRGSLYRNDHKSSFPLFYERISSFPRRRSMITRYIK